MRTVLIISYNWPPDASVGAVRPLKISKQLILHGWKPVILTVKERYYEKLNNEGGGAEDIVLCRTRCLPSPIDIYVSAKSALFKLCGRANKFKESTLRWTSETQSGVSSPTFTNRMKRLVLSLLYTPDEFQGWLPYAIMQSVRAVRAHSISCVVSTGPPFTAHLVGLAIKKLCGTMWVADFRDPWRQNEQRPSMFQSSFSDRMHRGLEAVVLRNAVPNSQLVIWEASNIHARPKA